MVVHEQQSKTRSFTVETTLELEEMNIEVREEGLDWASGLPVNIYDSILDRLPSVGDYVRFGAVCKSWLQVSLDQCNHRYCPRPLTQKEIRLQIIDNNHNHHHHLPLLMHPRDSVLDKGFLYNPTTKCEIDFELCVSYEDRFIGSSFGWLISVQTDFSITLFNPFSNNKVCLPPILPARGDDISAFQVFQDQIMYFRYQHYFRKAILSADPNLYPSDCIIIVIYGEHSRLACIRPQPQVPLDNSDTTVSNSWIYVNLNLEWFVDIIYYHGVFYALHETGSIYTVYLQAGSDTPALYRCIVPLDPGQPNCFDRYIVESCKGEILQVLRYGERVVYGGSTGEFHPKITSDFRVFKLDRSTQPHKWIELQSLEDQVLFLGDNSSLSVLASDSPGHKPGSIYYTWGYEYSRIYSSFNLTLKEYGGRPPDVGIFNLKDRQFVDMFNLKDRQFAFPSLNQHHAYAMYNRSPIWIVPTFQAPVLRKKSPNPDCPSARP